MKKLALFLSLVMTILSFGGLAVSAANIADDSTDGELVWGGYTWDAKCIPEGVATTVKNAEACGHGWMYVDTDGVMTFRMEHNGSSRGQFHMIQIPHGAAGLPENFDVEFDMQMTEYGEGLGFQIFVPGMRLYSEFESRGFLYQGNDGIKLLDYNMDNEWHNWRMAVREDKYSVFCDGQEILTDELQNVTTSAYDGDVRFYSSPSVNVSPKAQMKNFNITKYENYIGMTPDADSSYTFGENVVFKANVTDGAEKVTYYAGNVPIGTATAAENYEYTLDNPSVGAYTVWAKTSTGMVTFPRTFKVTNETDAEIVCSENINYGETAALLVENIPDSVGYVQYFVNGVEAGIAEKSPYSFEADIPNVGSSSVWAKIYMNDGTHVTTATKTVNVTAKSAGSYGVSREYDLTFKNSGSGSIAVNDGYFKLKMDRSGSGFTYETRDGTERFGGGSGVYRAIVSAGIADVYKDGQLAFSYYLPRSNGESGMNYSGFSDVVLTGSGVKNTVFERKFESERETLDENINMGLFYSLEFDKTDASSESILLYDGEYEISLKFNGGITALVQPETGGNTYEQKLTDKVESGYYRLTVYRGLANLFVDNRYVGAFRAPKEAGRKTLRRTMSNPGATTIAAIKNSDDVFYFTDDFSGNGQREPLEYWYNIYKDAKGTVENGAMKISGDGTWLLDATAENPEIRWTMTPELTETVTENSGSGSGSNCEGDNSGSVTTVTRSGKFAIGVRYRDEYDNVKIRYDHNGGVWSLTQRTAGTEETLATATKALVNNEAKKYELIVENDLLTLNCGGESIFSAVPLTFLGNGKFGLSLDGATSLTVDDISYVGNGKVNSGISYSFWTAEEVEETVEFLGGQNGEVYFSTLTSEPKRVVYTTTDGENWTGPVENTNFTRDAVNLQSGRVLRIESASGISRATLCEADGVTVATDDNGNNIAKFVSIQSPDDTARRWAMPGRLTQGKKVWGTGENAAPRVYYVMNEGSEVSGDITLYFSDDEGATWKESTTVLTYASMGNFYGGEPDVIELPDGRVRIYFRGDRGFLHYTDSYDGGVTFGLKPIPSRFMTPSTCFSIERDNESDSTYYIIWEYDTTTATNSYIQQPRNRQAVAVSYDGCENWEYIMEMDDRGQRRTTSHMNASMRVIGGKVYVNHAYLEALQYSDEEVIKNIVYIIDPQKMNAVKRFANAHYIEPDFKTVYEYVPSQAVIPKATGNALLYGNTIPVRIDPSGMVQASVMAQAVGAEAIATSNGVKLVIGDGVVLFKSGQTGYSINGEAVATEKVCLSADGEYLDAEVVAEIFGREYLETASTYLLLSTALSDTYVSELEMMATGVSEWLRICIEEFKSIETANGLKEFFAEYKVLLNLNTDFTDKSFENIFEAYKNLDLAEVVDSGTMLAAIDTLVQAEAGRVGEFLDALNTAAADGDATAIEILITETYGGLISVDADLSQISNKNGLFAKMSGITYNSVSEVENIYLAAYNSQLNLESGKTNSVALSTVSGGFESWNVLSDNNFGGVTKETVNGENVATMSAYESRDDSGKAAVEPRVDTICYHNPEEMKPKATNGEKNSETNSVILEKGEYLTFEGSNAIDSAVLTATFDMKKPEGTVSAYFLNGIWKTTVTFDESGTSLGELPETLKDDEAVSYRVDATQKTLRIYAKPLNGADTGYSFLGETVMTSGTKTKYQVKFTATSGNAEISNVGIYSGLSSIRYDIGGLEVMDDVCFEAGGAEGHTMADLAAISGALSNVTVDEKSGNLVMTKTADGANAAITISKKSGIMANAFEYAEIDLRVSAPEMGNFYYYFADGSKSRYKGYLKLDVFNGVSTGTNMPWAEGQFYDMKLITHIAGYDENGQARTSASFYAKKAEDEKWICIAQDSLLSLAQTNTEPHFVLMNTVADTTNEISKISIKTYKSKSGDVEYVNKAVNMPQVDYNFSFDYVRMDDDVPTMFTIGGADYGRSFLIQPYRITSDGAHAVVADIDIVEDKWYRIFGKVEMTQDAPYIHDSSVVLKNQITMYLEDEAGNVTLLFEDLPMIKQSGANGLKFGMYDADDAGIRLKNIRIHAGKALDFISFDGADGKAVILADFLNDETPLTEDVLAIASVYENFGFRGVQSMTLSDDIGAFEAKRMTFDNVEYQGNADSAKVFIWKDMTGFVPVTAHGEIN